jgi:hypothetical protein
MDFKLAHRAKYDVVEDEALTITYTQKKVTKTLESLDRLEDILHGRTI